MKKISLLGVLCLALTSCYNAHHIVGTGPSGSTVARAKNNYFLYGIVSGKQADTNAMAGDAANYKIDVQESFVDGLLMVVTFGIYTPMSVKVTK